MTQLEVAECVCECVHQLNLDKQFKILQVTFLSTTQICFHSLFNSVALPEKQTLVQGCSQNTATKSLKQHNCSASCRFTVLPLSTIRVVKAVEKNGDDMRSAARSLSKMDIIINLQHPVPYQTLNILEDFALRNPC